MESDDTPSFVYRGSDVDGALLDGHRFLGLAPQESDPGQAAQGVREHLRLTRRFSEQRRLLRGGLGGVDMPEPHFDVGQRRQRWSARIRRQIQCEQRAESSLRLRVACSRHPEAREQMGGTGGLVVVRLGEMIEHRAQVVGFPVEPGQVLAASGSEDASVFFFERFAIEQRMAASDRVGLAVIVQPVAGVLPDRFQHPVALVGEAQQALLDERLNRVEIGAGHLLRRLQRAAPGEDGERSKDAPLLLGEEVVAPGDRCP